MGNTGKPADVGRVGNISAESIRQALSGVTEGKVFDLDAGRFMGMPQWDGHPTFLISSYLTPDGTRVDNRVPLLDPASNQVDMRFHTEVVVTGMHIGTHIDALNHVVCGSDGDKVYGGYGPEFVGDSGPMKADASSIPPIIVSAVVFDFPTLHNVKLLPPSTPLGVEHLLEAEQKFGQIPSESAVIIRTGLMTTWPNPSAFGAASGAGITIEAATWLAEERGVVLVGSDTPTVEVVPSTVSGHPHPVHDYLLRQQGIHLLENLWLEDLATEGVTEGLLICLPLKMSGATGSMVRPVLVV
jgi:kynurenine formamidase